MYWRATSAHSCASAKGEWWTYSRMSEGRIWPSHSQTHLLQQTQNIQVIISRTSYLSALGIVRDLDVVHILNQDCKCYLFSTADDRYQRKKNNKSRTEWWPFLPLLPVGGFLPFVCCRVTEIAVSLTATFLIWQLALQKQHPFPLPFWPGRLLLPLLSPQGFILLGRSSQFPVWPSLSEVVSPPGEGMRPP